MSHLDFFYRSWSSLIRTLIFFILAVCSAVQSVVTRHNMLDHGVVKGRGGASDMCSGIDTKPRDLCRLRAW
jgi:hypothetical protein